MPMPGTISVKPLNYVPRLLFWSLTAALIFRFYWIICKYSVNLFFFDEWDIYSPLFGTWHWWQIFISQHGPHREGVGVVIVSKLLTLTRWDSRVQALSIGTAIVLAMFLAMYVKLRIFGPLELSDLIIPITFLGLGQWEVLLGGPGPSPQAFPLLLLFAYCLSWIAGNVLARNAFVLICNFLLIFTGYGIFISGITMVLLALDLYQNAKRHDRRGAAVATLSLGLSVASFASFFYHYHFDPAAGCYHFPYRNPAAYPIFAALMYSRFLGIKHGLIFASLIGLGAIGVVGALFVKHATRISWKDSSGDRQSLLIVVLAGYSLTYSAAAAVGRICLGLENARASRYLTLLIPAFLGIYFSTLTIQSKQKRMTLAALLFVLLLSSVIQRNHKEIESFSAFKTAWKDCYLAREDIKLCDYETGFQLYPCPECIHMQEKMEFLKQNRLNLYANRNWIPPR